MKGLFLTILISLGFSMNLIAQWNEVANLTTYDKKRIHFGFFLGTNFMDFGFSYYNKPSMNPSYVAPKPGDPAMNYDPNSFVAAEVSSLKPGFTVGIITSLRLYSWLDLRFLPGMSFGERTISYPFYDKGMDTSATGVVTGGTGATGSTTSTNKIYTPYSYISKSTYIDLPLLFKFKAQRAVNFRPYIVAGGSCRIDLETRDDDADLVKLKNLSYYADIGIGFDSFLQFFKFSGELRYSFGLNNVLGDIPTPSPENDFDPQYMYPLKSLRPQVVSLIFYFE
ncbi:PorT family protein [Halosquirtibacter xylanolyticus]|uniref:type IX secretion/gliding motility protein PorT/SprT n=1 Tax=Halosquirtibacter xylanolyticus TaxID=3374599 RepID=UPI003748ABD7|nr:PorT family protein [Prolixibacteraceae bacterium]